MDRIAGLWPMIPCEFARLASILCGLAEGFEPGNQFDSGKESDLSLRFDIFTIIVRSYLIIPPSLFF
jgi:hypothetical protein